MKILLVGEYSRLHNSLKEGLLALGHEVVLVASGDNFKDYTTDISLRASFFLDNWMARKFKNVFFRLTQIDLEKTERALRFYRLLPKLKGFDVVQLINSDALETHPELELRLYRKLFNQNTKARFSLLICGDETPVNDYLLQNKLRYSVLTPYLKNPALAQKFRYSLKYTTPPYRKLYNWVQQHANCLIVSDLDYKIPMEAMGHMVTFIPNPINTDTILPINTKKNEKVVIFLGINRLSYVKKGIAFFEEALQVIQKKYPEKTEIIISENVPYRDYIESYNKADIVLDQVYGFDQGYNALEAMAKGKVVFTGAETEFMQHYQLTERVAVNALPDAQKIADDLLYLIENPTEIAALGKRARAFIEKEHQYVAMAKKYVETWGFTTT